MSNLLLTRADRELFLSALQHPKLSWKGTDDSLLAAAADFACRHLPQFSFEHALLDNLVLLSSDVAKHPATSQAGMLARKALCYVLRSKDELPSKLRKFGLIDDAYVAAYAVCQIRDALGERAQFTPPRLTSDERKQAEKLFLRFVDAPAADDCLLVKSALAKLDEVSFAETGLFRRLRWNSEFLSQVVLDQKRSESEKSIARGALLYLLEDEDIVQDYLGLIGLVDDHFIVQMAADLIDSGREPWLDLLDGTIAAWPFLNAIYLTEDEKITHSLSEFLLVNAALICPELRKSSLSLTGLIVPTVGPLPFLLAFISALGTLAARLKEPTALRRFQPGEKVLLDYSAVKEFLGYRTVQGVEFFGLGETRKRGGQILEATTWLKISELERLLPADDKWAIRGQIEIREDKSAPMLAVEQLFLSCLSPSIWNGPNPVILCAPVGATEQLADSLSIFGHSLVDSIPIGTIRSNGEVEPWCRSFGNQQPLLLVGSDLDRILEFIEVKGITPRAVIVDFQGHNSNRSAALARLKNASYPTTLVIPEAETHALASDEIPISWEWDCEDLKSLCWAFNFQAGSGPIRKYEKRIERNAESDVEVRVTQGGEPERVFHPLRRLQKLAFERGEHIPQELSDIIFAFRGAFWPLLRTFFPLDQTPELAVKIGDCITRGRELTEASSSLLQAEKELCLSIAQELELFFERMKISNPKARAISTILEGYPQARVVVSDEADIPPNPGMYLVDENRAREEETAALIIPAWLGRRYMPKFLHPPIASKVILCLYPLEIQWFEQLSDVRKRQKHERRRRSDRATVFPSVEGWRKKPELTDTPTPAGDDEERIAVELDRLRYRGYIHRAQATSSEESLPARLFAFSNEHYAFLSEGYEARVVNHLLREMSSEEQEKAQVIVKPASSVAVGDILLFHSGSGRDVIRETADKILPASVREMAGTWKEALRRYRLEQDISVDVLHRRLNKAGCPLGYAAVRSWLNSDDIIGPAEFDRDLPIIASLTKDTAFAANLPLVIESIRAVRSAHLQACFLLAKQIVQSAVKSIRSCGGKVVLGHLEGGLLLLRVLHTENEPIPVKIGHVNRIMEGSWHE